jgi:LytS/YehU family sensor histidine kinase
LEQQALQAQMNPHFIFNCLNSIQQFLDQNRLQDANHFLSSFANLVRDTLDISSKQFITINDEILYLEKYFALEKLRYEDNLEYQIIVDSQIDKDDVRIPTLLLQPFVENALRHGIRHKDAGGQVIVRFFLEDKCLVCIVEDNGIGRKQSRTVQSRQHIEYQSRGMNITQERMNSINVIFNNQISVRVIDKAEAEDGEDDIEGTSVVIKIPVEIYG